MNNLDCKMTLWGYDKFEIAEIINEKDRLIQTQEKDVECLKREIKDLKNQINCSKNKKK